MNLFLLSAFGIFLILLHFTTHYLLKWRKYLRENRYVGYGVLLGVRLNVLEVRILVRLTNSPAGRAGIPNDCKLLELDGRNVSRLSTEEFLAHLRVPKRIGDPQMYTVETRDGKIFTRTLHAEVIQGPIPYHTPQETLPLAGHDRHLVREIPVWYHEPRTDQAGFEIRRSLSNEAVENVLLPRG